MNDVAERLLVERQRLSVSQSDFAEAAGVAYGTYLNYEKGRRSPDAEFLFRLSNRGVDVLFVITGRRDTGNLSSTETGLIGDFRMLQPHQQSALAKFVQSMTFIKAS